MDAGGREAQGAVVEERSDVAIPKGQTLS